MGSSMHALRIPPGAGPEGLRYEQAPVPEPAIGDVMVRVLAASFIPDELRWPSTWVDRSGRDRLPVIPGHEVCGVVVDVGYGTSGWRIGDQVFGLCDWYRDGAAAEYVAVEARNLAAKPRRCSATDAASAPLAGLTAWQALLQHGQLAPGDTVLVVGAAGGVGVYAVQLARHVGARVIGAGRASHEATVRDLGSAGFVALVGEVDLVLDLVGGGFLEQLISVRHAHTRVVSVVEPRDDVEFFVVEPDRSTLSELARMIDAGDVRPVVGAITPLADGAHAFASKRGVGGKGVLEVAAG